MASKRKRSVMSLEKKLDIITQIRQGRSQRAVADGFVVAKSTVGDIWKIERRSRFTCLLALIPRSLRNAVLFEMRISISLTRLVISGFSNSELNICTMHAIYGFSELRTFLTYGHPSVPCCPDKGGLTVPIKTKESI